MKELVILQSSSNAQVAWFSGHQYWATLFNKALTSGSAQAQIHLEMTLIKAFCQATIPQKEFSTMSNLDFCKTFVLTHSIQF